MNVSKRLNYFCIGLVLASSLLLWDPPPASSFGQSGGGGSQAGGVTMLKVSGKVVETMNGGGYTYALVKKDGAKNWVALPNTRIAVGDEITCKPGMVMNNFGSSALRRTFKSIVFSGGLISYSSDATPQTQQISPAATQGLDKGAEVPKPKPVVEDWKNF